MQCPMLVAVVVLLEAVLESLWQLLDSRHCTSLPQAIWRTLVFRVTESVIDYLLDMIGCELFH